MQLEVKWTTYCSRLRKSGKVSVRANPITAHILQCHFATFIIVLILTLPSCALLILLFPGNSFFTRKHCKELEIAGSFSTLYPSAEKLHYRLLE